MINEYTHATPEIGGESIASKVCRYTLMAVTVTVLVVAVAWAIFSLVNMSYIAGKMAKEEASERASMGAAAAPYIGTEVKLGLGVTGVVDALKQNSRFHLDPGWVCVVRVLKAQAVPSTVINNAVSAGVLTDASVAGAAPSPYVTIHVPLHTIVNLNPRPEKP